MRSSSGVFTAFSKKTGSPISNEIGVQETGEKSCSKLFRQYLTTLVTTAAAAAAAAQNSFSYSLSSPPSPPFVDHPSFLEPANPPNIGLSEIYPCVDPPLSGRTCVGFYSLLACKTHSPFVKIGRFVIGSCYETHECGSRKALFLSKLTTHG